jgi:hypothetical protein
MRFRAAAMSRLAIFLTLSWTPILDLSLLDNAECCIAVLDVAFAFSGLA